MFVTTPTTLRRAAPLPVFHDRTDLSTTEFARRSLERLEAALGRLSARGLAGEDFEGFERECHALFAAAEREVLGGELEALDIDRPDLLIEGRRHHRVLRSSETYTSAAGPVTVGRTLYRAGRGRSVVPLELRAGIVAGHWTPLAARQASFLVSHLTPQESEDTLRELGNMAPSQRPRTRPPKRLTAPCGTARGRFGGARTEGNAVAERAVAPGVSLDGVMVPMRDGARQGKRAGARAAGKQATGPAGYREESCATLAFYDREGERLDTVRFARMPEAKKATLKATLSAEVRAVLGQRPELTVVKVADGAKDNWSYLAKLVPEGEERVDFFHAAEQLKAAFDAAYGQNNATGKVQFAKNRHVLREDLKGVEKVIRALVYLRAKHPRRKRIGEVLGYFRGNRHRMDYAGAALRALPIGSGVVEAACKTLATQRLKRSGMRWRNDGGQAILTLRGWVQSHRFDHAWQLLSETYRADISISDNVIELPCKRAA